MSRINIKIVSEDALITIKKNVSTVSEYVKNEKENDWLSVVLHGVSPIFIEKKITIEDFELEENIKLQDKKIDYENSIKLYEHLKDVSRFILSSENFWLWLYLEKFYSVVRGFMPISSSSTFKDHYLFSGGIRRGIFFGCLSRMYYRVALTVDESKEDKYELTRWIIDNPERFRNLSWRAYSSEHHLVRGAIRGEKRFVEEYGEDNKLYQEIAKKISLYGSVKLLDSISEEDIENMVYNSMKELKIKKEEMNDETIC